MKDFEHLPYHVLKEIFQNLDVGSLKNASLTCKAWKRVTDKMPWHLCLEGETYCDREDLRIELQNHLMSSSKRFERVKLVADSLNRYGDALRFLEPDGQRATPTPESVKKFFDFLPNLNHIILDDIPVMSRLCNSFHPAPEFKQLKRLDVSYSRLDCSVIFEQAQLQEVNLRMTDGCDYDWFWGFMATQKALKSLELHICSDIRFQTPANLELITCKLAKLSIWDYRDRGDQCDQDLLMFIKHQAETLKELEISMHKGFPESILEFIINKLKYLKTLKVSLEDIPTEIGFYDQVEDNLSVESLSVMHQNEDNNAVIGLLRRFPNVVQFEVISCLTEEVWNFASTRYTKLEKLVLENNSRSEFIHFPSLKRIDVQNEYSDMQVDWSSLTKGNPNVEEVRIYSFCSKLIDIETILTNWNLHTLIFENIIIDREFFNMIRQKGKSLKLLKIPMKVLKEMGLTPSDVADIASLHLSLRSDDFTHSLFSNM